jgi:mono/diheme cytochrome c family protein
MTGHQILVRWAAGNLCGIALLANPASAQGRGESLYSTHCAACHTAQMHWRINGAVKDWPSLKDEVRKWQVVASLAWTEDDVLDVARYLNDSIYHFEQTNERLSSTRARRD